MTFQPILPLSGYAGWLFLDRTLEPQKEAFNASQDQIRKTEYFLDNISKVVTAADLLDDRRLLEVALGAFGLSDDIDNRFFIQKVLEDGTSDPQALSNRLSDKRYAGLSQAFGFGDSAIPLTSLNGFATKIIDQFENNAFEQAVGAIDNDARLALNMSSELSEIVENNQTDDARWFQIMGSPPVRQIFEAALGLPSSIGTLNIDRQLDAFRAAASSRFGTDEVEKLSGSDEQEKLIRLFFLNREVSAATASTGASVALSLLTSAL